MAVIPIDFGSGGKGLAKASPVSAKDILFGIADDLAGTKVGTISQAALDHSDDVAYDGGIVLDPTTPSSQLTGDGNTTWNVDVSAALAKVNSVDDEVAASADEAIHSGSELMDAGESCYAWVVLAESGGALAIDSVVGTPATTGSQTIPDDAAITTGVGHANWMKLALCLLNRTADTTVTQSQDNTTYRKQFVAAAADALINAIRTAANAVAGYTVTTTKGT